MTTSSSPGPWELGDYLAVLRRRWWIIAMLASAGLLVAGAVVMLAPKVYTATAAVYVPSLRTDDSQVVSGTTGALVDMDTEAQIVRSQTVAELAARRIRTPVRPRQLTSQVSVTVPPNSTVLDIACDAPRPARAAACADAIAGAYLALRLSDATDAVQSALSAEQSKMNLLAGQIAALKATLGARRPSATSNLATGAKLSTEEAQLRDLVSQVDILAPQLASLQAPHNSLAGHVISGAARPSSPSSPSASLLLPTGLLAGLIIGLLAAFLVDLRDERLHTPRDVERLLDIPVLLSFDPEPGELDGGLARAGSKVGRAFAGLARSHGHAQQPESHVLLVAGASPGAGASVIAVNLAVALARTSAESVLVFAAVPGTVAPRLLGAHDPEGMADLLDGCAVIGDVTRTVPDLPNLLMIGPGHEGARTVVDHEHDLGRSLIAGLRSRARHVVIEAFPTDDGFDALALAEFADAAIVVVEADRTCRDDAVDCLRRLDLMGTRVLGAVITSSLGGADARPAAVTDAGPRPASQLPPRTPAQRQSG